MADSFVLTKSALSRKDAAADFQFVSHTSYKSKPKAPAVVKGEEIESVEKDNRKGIDIQRARREVIKFGITGFSHGRQQEAKVALAISLGARPPRGENRNYKELMAERERQKRLDRKYAVLQQAGKNGLGASTARKKFVFGRALPSTAPRKAKDGLLEDYGKATIPTTPSCPPQRTGGRGGGQRGHGGAQRGHGGAHTGHGGPHTGHGGAQRGHGGSQRGRGGPQRGRGGSQRGRGGSQRGRGGKR